MKGIFLRREWVSLVCCFCIIGVCLVHTALGEETKALFPMMGVRVVLDAVALKKACVHLSAKGIPAKEAFHSKAAIANVPINKSRKVMINTIFVFRL